MAKVKNILTTGIIVFLGLILVVKVVLLACGIKSYAVKTPSMEPDYKVGSIVYVKKLARSEVYEKLTIGDDITYMTSTGVIVTHRIVQIDEDDNRIVTSGIAASSTHDAPIAASQVIGKVVFNIGLIGYVILLFQNIYFLVGFVLVIIMGVLVYYLVKELKKNKDTTNN